MEVNAESRRQSKLDADFAGRVVSTNMRSVGFNYFFDNSQTNARTTVLTGAKLLTAIKTFEDQSDDLLQLAADSSNLSRRATVLEELISQTVDLFHSQLMEKEITVE